MKNTPIFQNNHLKIEIDKRSFTSIVLASFTIILISLVQLLGNINRNIGYIEKPVINSSSFLQESNPEKKEVKPVEVNNDKMIAYKSYINRYKDVAQAEMHKYGIPASIKLAQALLESNAGKSKLAKKNNNHFGIKCFSKKCKKGHCSNFSDDSHKDFFRKYPTVWESYRAHSLFLKQKRYKRLFDIPASDYKAWAKGLQNAGYATDKNYSKKLIEIIEQLKLNIADG